MDPGVCGPYAPQNMNVAPSAMAADLYFNHCYDSTGKVLRGTTRAIALADPNRPGLDPVTNAPYALLYDRDTMGADGVIYAAGTPVVIFRNATGGYGGGFDPLVAGNYKANRLTNPGQFTLDANMTKNLEFMEGKRLEIRIDAANILNRANMTGTAAGSQRYLYGGRVVNASDPAGLSLNVAGNAVIGNMPGKVGHRTFQARLALRF
jgi:hypothetical protein